MYVGAAIHDYGHKGLNNAYLLRTEDELALIYNDKSVLENFHISAFYQSISKSPSKNIF